MNQTKQKKSVNYGIAIIVKNNMLNFMSYRNIRQVY
jgi:hypothetical protein